MHRAARIDDGFQTVEAQPVAGNRSLDAQHLIKRGCRGPCLNDRDARKDQNSEYQDENARRRGAAKSRSVGNAGNEIIHAHGQIRPFAQRLNGLGRILDGALDIFQQLIGIRELEPFFAASRAFHAPPLRRKRLRRK